MTRFLVIGANGHVGREVVAQLVDAGHEVRAMVREAPKVAALGRSGVEVVKGDVSKPETLPAAVAGIGRAYYATNDPEGSVAMLESFLAAAKAAGVGHVVRLSAQSADPEAEGDLSRRHGLAEKALEASGLAWTHLRPSWFMQMMFDYAPGGVIALPGGEGRTPWIDCRDIAAVAVAALTGEGHAGKTWELTGPAGLTYGELAETMTKETGRTFVYRDLSPDAYRAKLKAEGESDWYITLLLQLYARIRADTVGATTDGVERALGRPATSFAQFCRDHVAELVKQL